MNPGTASTALSSPKLLEQIANACRTRHYSRSTAKTYQYWAKHFILYGRRQAGRFVHPRELGAAEIEADSPTPAPNDTSPSRRKTSSLTPRSYSTNTY